MIKQEFKSLGHKVAFSVPSSVEEFDTNAKKTGAALAEAINNIVYRGNLAEFRDVFLHGRKADAKATPPITAIDGIEARTGIERNTTPVFDKDKKPVIKDGEPVVKYSESELDYYNRVIATLVEQGKFKSEEEATASFQSLADEVADSTIFDASASERKATGPKKLAAKYKITAARILANGTVEAANTNYLTKINKVFIASGDTSKTFKTTYEDKVTNAPKTIEVSDKDAEALGWLLKEYSDWKASQEMDSMAG